MPKSIHKSADIYLKIIQNLKESKQGPHKSGTPESSGSQDTSNRITVMFWGVVGRRVGFRSQHGAKWTNMEPKGHQTEGKNVQNMPKTFKMKPKLSQTF